MKGLLKILLGLTIIFAGFYSIKHILKSNITRSMYYWSTDRKRLSALEIDALKELKITKLYVKFFEVEKSGSEIIPVEKSKLEFKDEVIEIVPTIYVRNKVFKESTQDELSKLAQDVFFLIDKIYKRNISKNKVYKEIQIDCDWTIETQQEYFYFLKELKKIIKGKTLSATLRLYAFKFPEKMGVLPVDRASLMCYNLLSPIDSENRNSILDLEELDKYLNGAEEYPIPLDVALPIYSDVQIYHNSTYSGLVYNEDPMEIREFYEVKKYWRKVDRDTLYHNYFLRQGDLLKHETVSVNLLSEASRIIQTRIPSAQFETLILFHLDEMELKYYTYEELDALYDRFDR